VDSGVTSRPKKCGASLGAKRAAPYAYDALSSGRSSAPVSSEGKASSRQRISGETICRQNSTVQIQKPTIAFERALLERTGNTPGCVPGIVCTLAATETQRVMLLLTVVMFRMNQPEPCRATVGPAWDMKAYVMSGYADGTIVRAACCTMAPVPAADESRQLAA